jgi:hypothetical protein
MELHENHLSCVQVHAISCYISCLSEYVTLLSDDGPEYGLILGQIKYFSMFQLKHVKRLSLFKHVRFPTIDVLTKVLNPDQLGLVMLQMVLAEGKVSLH